MSAREAPAVANPASSLSDDVRRAYDHSGASWDLGPSRVYRALAQPVLDAASELRGARVLDVGTGTGVLADALVARGANVIGFDISWGMVRLRAAQRPPAAVADVRELPVRAAVADLVTAAFVLNHLDDPVPAVRELRRVLRPGGRLLATTFEGDAPHPAKGVLDRVASSYGWTAPPWYDTVKHGTMPLVGSCDRFGQVGQAGGLCQVVVERVPVVLALSPAELVGWRYGMAQLAPFVAGLPEPQRAALVAEAQVAVAEVAEPVEMAVLVLSAVA